MQENDLLGEGLNLMVFGMGFVFVFLSLLVVAMMAMAKLVDRFAPEPPAIAPRRAANASGVPATADDGELTAVMTAAIHRFRQDHNRH
ncbi:OadG family protein [Cobetia sp. L2A1]|uniref:OadG family protein n=1 Tax=Cobetia sp. L2A1 TaxID=2686360 RepID=UPI00131C2BD8|nr:OadG family protein [Cobetia sp. L2A1]